MTTRDILGRDHLTYSRVEDASVNSIEGIARVKMDTYTQQFSHIYFCRLKALFGPLREAALSRWQSDLHPKNVELVDKILDVRAKQKSIIFGVLFADLSKKPNILDDVDLESSGIDITPNFDSYVGDFDHYFLEDESGRVELAIDSEQHLILSGLCVAIMGSEREDGRFHVEDMVFPGLAPQSERPHLEQDEFVMIMSGLRLSESLGVKAGVEVFSDFLAGAIRSHHIPMPTSLILLGNCLGAPPRAEGSGKKKYGLENSRVQVSWLGDVDDRIEYMARCVDVYMIPGKNDPVALSLPQKAILPGILPKSSNLSSLSLLTNPSWLDLNGVQILATAGQNIDDGCRYSSHADPIDVAKLTLLARHSAPSAPDTLCIVILSQSHI